MGKTQDVIFIVEWLLNTAYNVWEKHRQVTGADELPEWDAIANKNARLQAKIDAEKTEGP